jgi:hypothetical protein
MIKRKRSLDIPVLTEDEKEIITLGRENPNIFTDYWFRPYGEEKGFLFDENFDPEGAWQLKAHNAAQSDIIVVGGFFSGKTLGIGVSMFVWGCQTYPDFRFLGVANTLKQSRYMYDKIIALARNTPAERLIFSAPLTPWPRIEIKFWWDDTLVESYLEWGSLDNKTASEAISGFEGDIICIDEAFQIPNLEDMLTILGTRVRGSFRGRERVGRFIMLTNSWENPYGWYLWDLASSDPMDHLSILVASKHNHNVTPDQLRRAAARIPEDERDRFLEGIRPQGKGIYFSNDSIYACEDALIGQLAEDFVRSQVPGWNVIYQHGAGIVYYTQPPEKGHKYLMFGDPGTKGAPNRDAPVWIVWDVTNFPNEPANLVAFWWGNGKGQIIAFIGTMVRFILMYRPYMAGMDSTGTQKNAAMAINLHLRGGRIKNPQILAWLGKDIDTTKGIKIPKDIQLIGMDFSVGKKGQMLFSGKMMLDAHRFRWPKSIAGIRSQLSMYDPLDDKPSKPKFPQDIVAVICMSAHAIQNLFAIELDENETEDDEATADSLVSPSPRGDGRYSPRAIVRIPR